MRPAKQAWRPFVSCYRHPTLRIEDKILVAILLNHPGLCNLHQHCALKVPVSAHLRVYMCHDSNLSCLLASVTLQSKLQQLNGSDNGVCLWWQEPVTLLPVLPRLHSHEKFCEWTVIGYVWSEHKYSPDWSYSPYFLNRGLRVLCLATNQSGNMKSGA